MRTLTQIDGTYSEGQGRKFLHRCCVETARDTSCAKYDAIDVLWVDLGDRNVAVLKGTCHVGMQKRGTVT